MKTAIQHLKISSARFHNFAFYLLTFYFLKLFNQFESIMQNKPNFRKAKMSASSGLAEDYEKTGLSDKGKTNPIQSQYKPNSNPIQSQNRAKTNPIKPNFNTNYQLMRKKNPANV